MRLFGDDDYELVHPCEHGRPSDGCFICDRHRLARSGDPSTSKAAAGSVSLDLGEGHRAVLEWLRVHGPATDDEVAWAMVEAGQTRRPEAARRWVRTLRENHGAIVAARGPDGEQIVRRNESGRMAFAWVAR